MTAFFGVWHFTHRGKLLKVPSTVSLASYEEALTSPCDFPLTSSALRASDGYIHFRV